MSLAVGSLLPHSPAADRPDLLAGPVLSGLLALPDGPRVGVVEIDPSVSDTGAFVERYGVPPEVSANCVVVAGRRDGEERVAACMVLATTRADVNGVVKRALDVRKCSFLSMEQAVERTGMEYGGITPVGLPAGWRLLVDARIPAIPAVVIGSGVRHGKLVLPGDVLAALPGAEVLDGLANELTPAV